VSLVFKDQLLRVFTKNVQKWRPVLENTQIQSFEYWAYKSATQNLTLVKFKPSLYKASTLTPFFNLVFYEKGYVNIPLFKTYFRVCLLNILKLLLSP